MSDLTGTEKDLWHQLIVSITIGAAFLFALLSFIPSQWLGRKMTILSASVIFTVGSVVMGIANNKEILLIGRLIVGIAIGNKITIIYVKM